MVNPNLGTSLQKMTIPSINLALLYLGSFNKTASAKWLSVSHLPVLKIRTWCKWWSIDRLQTGDINLSIPYSVPWSMLADASYLLQSYTRFNTSLIKAMENKLAITVWNIKKGSYFYLVQLHSYLMANSQCLTQYTDTSKQ